MEMIFTDLSFEILKWSTKFMTDIAFTLIAPVIAGFFLGYAVDQFFHNKFPAFTVGMVLLGMCAGIWSVYKKSLK